MERETLQNLGLEKETIETIMSEYGKSLNSIKRELDIKNNELDQISNKLKDIEQKKEEKNLKEVPKDLNNVNDDKITEIKNQYQNQINEIKFDYEIRKKINGKVYDEDIVIEQLKKAGLEFTDSGIQDLDKKLENLKEQKNYLFINNQKQEETVIKGISPVEKPDKPTEIDPLFDRINEMMGIK